MGCDVLDNVRLNWNPRTTTDLKISIVIIMVLVRPGLTKIYIIYICKNPWTGLSGILCQFILFSIFTFFNELGGVTNNAAPWCFCHSIPSFSISPYFTYKSIDPVVTK